MHENVIDIFSNNTYALTITFGKVLCNTHKLKNLIININLICNNYIFLI